MQTGKLLKKYVHDPDKFDMTIFNQYLITGSDDCTISSHPLDLSKFEKEYKTSDFPDVVLSLTSYKDQLIIGGEKEVQGVKYYNPQQDLSEQGQNSKLLYHSNLEIYDLDVCESCEQLAIASGENKLAIVNMKTLECKTVDECHQGAIISVSFHPQGLFLASIGADGYLRIYDLTSSNKFLAKLKICSYSGENRLKAKWHPSGSHLAVPGDILIRLVKTDE